MSDSENDNDNENPTAAFTAEQRKLIVDGMFGDRETMLAEFEQQGFDRKLVLSYTATLGLHRQFIESRRRSLSVSTPKLRECLACEREFVSLGPQHRMCRRCRREG